ncbi:hypothetical protein Dsin_028936 [Dipteronia sinensis]|uniref:RNase H type-1 domain-containing protein n=1 Tax=Dipteronia sinensis TaxID=43782 RepID=A0AAD9ZRI2_9ROSI|nr:hypothetical protein Dsin_028936 [Dipteronia sinensis]
MSNFHCQFSPKLLMLAVTKPFYSQLEAPKLLVQATREGFSLRKGWNANLFPAGGKEVLVKAVIQAIPTYGLSLFRLPKCLIKDIHRLCARFWWGGTYEGWSGWRLVANPLSLAARVLKSRYYRGTSFMNAKKGASSSMVWNSLLWGRGILKAGTRWLIVHGLTDDVKVILSLPISSTRINDSLIWQFDKSEVYSVLSGYKVGREMEVNAIWGCPKLKEGHLAASYLGNLNWNDNDPTLDFLLYCSTILVCEDLEVLCVILCRCWWRRNQLVHNDGTRGDENVVSWAINFLDEFRKPGSRDVVNEPKLVTKWRSPVVNMYKVNTDAAVCSEGNSIGIGIVVRDHKGCVMGCSSQSLTVCFSPQVAEATALLCGVFFAVDSGLLLAEVEYDAKSVVDLINSGNAPIADIGIVISDILRIIKCHNIRVSFAPRSTNMVAHCLAKMFLGI